MEYRKSITSLIQLLEAKDSLIKKLDLTDNQKEELINFFRKHPNYESKIDWNRKDLQWSDFEELLKLEGKSKSQAKKKGIEGLVEETDYKVLYQNGPVTIYYPLTHLGSKVLASVKTEPAVEAKWCISMNESTYWDKYTTRAPYYDFFFVFINNPEWQDIFKKVAFCRSLNKFNPNHTGNTLEIFTADDRTLYKDTYTRWLKEQYSEAYDKLKDLVNKYPSEIADDEYFDKTGIHITKAGVLDFIDRSRYRDNYDEELEFIIPEGCIQVAPWVASSLDFTKIIFPKSLESIGNNAFSLSCNLKKIKFPAGSKLTQIGNEAFDRCRQLQEVILPEGLQIIWRDAFSGCGKVKKINLPNTIRTIDDFAFQEMHSLEEITLPKNLQYLGRSPFLRCDKLRRIIYPGTIREFLNIEIEGQAKTEAMLIKFVNPAEAISWDVNGMKPLNAWTVDRIANHLVSKGTWLNQFEDLSIVQDYEDDKIDTLDIRIDLVCADMTVPLKFCKKQNWN